MLTIGNIRLEYPTVLAPMASLTDIVFRRIVDEIGGVGLMVTELISAEGLKRKQEKTLMLMRTFEFRTPQFIQLFGADPEAFRESVKYIQNETCYKGIDINMGCPARKIVKKGAGSALLRDPGSIRDVCRAVKSAAVIPVTVKVRLGYDSVNLYDVLDVLEGEGVDAVTVHFRLRTDKYSSPARWEYANGLRERYRIPLVGNGDIRNREDALQRMKLVDGIMIGRAAVRDPFIFSEISGNDPRATGKHDVAVRIMELIEEYYPEKLRLARIKSFTKYLTAGRPHSKTVKQEIYKSGSFHEVKSLFKTVFN